MHDARARAVGQGPGRVSGSSDSRPCYFGAITWRSRLTCVAAFSVVGEAGTVSHTRTTPSAVIGTSSSPSKMIIYFRVAGAAPGPF